jgi:cyclopropane-fatty-acyl-phospholipid synthase
MVLSESQIRSGVAFAVKARAARPPGAALSDTAFAAAMTAWPIAAHAGAANSQHYELPADFFQAVLGPRLKYSSGLYADAATSLTAAEEAALAETAAHAGLADGQRILELGCGWGSLSLWMAEHYPAARITAVSNSASQRAFIEARAAERGLANLTIVTADMNTFMPEPGQDRIVSVEMFEHMRNWPELLARLRPALARDGRLFLHVFTHREQSSTYDHQDPADWIGQHFFTGGIMPSHGLIRQFPDLFAVEEEWRWSGTHYQRTAEDWLANYRQALPELRPLLRAVYGDDALLWERRWLIFFLGVAEMFGHAGGSVWGVSHYLLRPRR